MEVVIGKLAGFCGGVKKAVEEANKNVNEQGKVYCLGELVHNKQVVDNLGKKGMITVNSLDEIPVGETVIFRAHGEAKNIYEKAEEKSLNIIDLTCINVKRIHEKVEKEKQKSFIIILGNPNHPEVIGTKGFAGNNSYIVETEDDILDAYMEYEKTSLGKVYVVAQTTFSSKDFDNLAQEIETNFIEADVIIDKTICKATENRQKEVEEMSKIFHTMVIVGGKNSSNTKELIKIANKNCKNVYAVQTVEDLKEINFSGADKIGLMAGASTPNSSIEGIKEYLKNIYS